MNRVGICLVWILTIICAALATSCSKGSSPEPTRQAGAPSQPSAQPAAQPAAAPAQPAPAAVPAGGIANGQSNQDPDLRCDLMEVKRISGGALVVKWRLVNAAAQAKIVHYYSGWNVHVNYAALYYIDPAENKKYSYLADTDGNAIANVFQGDIPAGEQRGNWAKFPAPPATSGKISISIPDFPPFDDVSISQ
ncbi:MAG: hypothetical protein ACLQVM_00960 [Terriglobia bacterium]